MDSNHSQQQNMEDQVKNSKKNIHILFIVENNTVPPDIRVWREATTAREAGHSVSIISPKNSTYSKNYEVVDGIEVYRHPSIENKRGKINQVIEYANSFFWENLLCVRVFLKKRFQIIHAANPPDHIFLIALIFKLFGVKFIFDHHDLAPELYLSKFKGKKNIIFKLLNTMEELSCKTADAVISTNESYKKHIMEKYGIRPEKIFIVRNDPEGPGKAIIENIRQYNNGSTSKLLYIGSINIQDGVDLLIKAVDILVNQLNQKKVLCTVVGDGDDLSGVKKLCAEMNMSRYFDFTGYIYDRDRVKTLLSESDVCLEPAPYNEVNSRSTFIKVMEYMAAGKPIVAFDLDETRYSAQGSALLIEQGDLNSFAEAIKKLICNPGLRDQLGRVGQRRIERDLNWYNSSKGLIQAYEYVSKDV